MSFIHRANLALNATERDLRDLTREALENGDYDAVASIAEIARQVGALVVPVKGLEVPVAEESYLPSAESARVTPAHSTSRPVSSRRGKNAYPRFRRDGDNLVKIGWSKTGKSEYEQRAPRRVVDELAAKALEATKREPVFTLEQLLPLTSDDGGATPTYQAYICLAWFRLESLVNQHGRRGYSLGDASSLNKSLHSAWDALPRFVHHSK